MFNPNEDLQGSVAASDLNSIQTPKTSQSKIYKEVQKLRTQIEIRYVDVLIAGGGPATLGLLCNAKKTGRLRELVTPSSEEVTAGIAILERGNTLGGGNL